MVVMRRRLASERVVHLDSGGLLLRRRVLAVVLQVTAHQVASYGTQVRIRVSAKDKMR